MILPGATVGILGTGQLGRMIGIAARQLGYGVVVYGPPGDAPAAGIADEAFFAPWSDEDALRAFAARADVVTYEFENVPVAAVEAVAARVPVRPDGALLGWTQDRLAEHGLLDELGIPHAAGAPVATVADLDAAVATHGMPGRIKTARGGYDGGGQWRIREAASLAVARDVVAEADGRTFRFERDVPFDREVSVIVARGAGGEVAFPLFENDHRDGILSVTRWPARVGPAVRERALDYARRIARRVDLCGTLTVECFVVGDDVLVNELAPRVHNSGHLTIEGCATSQFEQHVRAVCGLPLGPVTPRGAAAMANLLGDGGLPGQRASGVDVALSGPDEVHVHLYGKHEARSRRKVGHVTALHDDADQAVLAALRAAGAIHWAPRRS